MNTTSNNQQRFRARGNRACTWVFLILGIACLVYGIVIMSLGSGTMFFAVWYGLAALCFVVAACIRFRAFAILPKAAKRVAGVVLGLALALTFAVCLVETGLIASAFSSAGKPGLDYLIVLGAQVRDGGPSTVLKYRLDTAADYLRDNPETICIVTGGQGANETLTEAEVMRNYLVGIGVDPARVLVEPQAENTQQNIAYSRKLIADFAANDSDLPIADDELFMESNDTARESNDFSTDGDDVVAGSGNSSVNADDFEAGSGVEAGSGSPSAGSGVPSIGIVTNDFHVFRSLALAKKQGLTDVYGIAAPSDLPYLPNNVLREYFGITKDFLMGNL